MKFDVKMLIKIDEEANILPVAKNMHEDSVKQLVQDSMYDVEVEIKQIEVKKKR